MVSQRPQHQYSGELLSGADTARDLFGPLRPLVGNFPHITS